MTYLSIQMKVTRKWVVEWVELLATVALVVVVFVVAVAVDYVEAFFDCDASGFLVLACKCLQRPRRLEPSRFKP